MVNTRNITGGMAAPVPSGALAVLAPATNMQLVQRHPGGAVQAAYTNNVWSGTLPAATGFIEKQYAATPIAQQKAQAQAMHKFLLDPTTPLLNLNTNRRRFTAMINIPHSNKVKLICGVGFGASAIGAASPTDGKLLMLSGEGNKMLGCPMVFCLPADMHQKAVVKCPMEAALQASLQGGNNPNLGHQFVANAVPSGDMAEMLQIVVVPPLIMFDGFCGDIEAEDV
eukprot:10941801-Ditylum_brightwellii.AAC.1